jgi:hypothetical protein
MRPDIDAIVRLADLYGAPLEDTARLFSTAVRHPLLVLIYEDAPVNGKPGLVLQETIGSDYEGAVFADLAISETIEYGHAWHGVSAFRLFVEDHVVNHGYCRRFECGVVRHGERVLVSLRPVAERVHLIRSVDADARLPLPR